MKIKLISDAVLILVLLAASLLSIFMIKAFSEEGNYVRVSVDGETVCEYPLSEDGVYSLNGGTNILVIKEGEAYVSEASCPDGLCVYQGKISLVGERIVCLPNRVMAEVVGEQP